MICLPQVLQDKNYYEIIDKLNINNYFKQRIERAICMCIFESVEPYWFFLNCFYFYILSIFVTLKLNIFNLVHNKHFI